MAAEELRFADIDPRYKFVITDFSLDPIENNNTHVKILATKDTIEVDTFYLEKDTSGMKLWPCASEFCRFINLNQEQFKDKKIIELGAGAGLPSLFVASIAKQVVATDGDERVMKMLEKNAELNHLSNFSVQKLDWSDDKAISSILNRFGPLDMVIATEILYAEAHPDPFLQCVRKLLAHGGFLVISIAVRLKDLIRHFHQLATNTYHLEPIEVNYQCKNNPISASQAFKVILKWKVPSLAEKPLKSQSNTLRDSFDEDSFFPNPTEG